jgi:hypothetical protein
LGEHNEYMFKEILGMTGDDRGQQLVDYVNEVTKAAGLNAHYEWGEDEVVFHVE